MKITILIPVFNDWQSLFKLLENINSEVSNLDHDFSLIIVNDASTENKPEISSNFELRKKCDLPPLLSIKVLKSAVKLDFFPTFLYSFWIIALFELNNLGLKVKSLSIDIA